MRPAKPWIGGNVHGGRIHSQSNGQTMKIFGEFHYLNHSTMSKKWLNIGQNSPEKSPIFAGWIWGVVKYTNISKHLQTFANIFLSANVSENLQNILRS